MTNRQPGPVLGLRTVVYRVPDREKARDWYRAALGVDPYFDEPFYVGFNIGGFELGLDPQPPEDQRGLGTSVTYWGVPQLDAAVAHFVKLGATVHDAPRAVGGDIRVAAVKDPFGNLVGLIENPQFRFAEK